MLQHRVIVFVLCALSQVARGVELREGIAVQMILDIITVYCHCSYIGHLKKVLKYIGLNCAMVEKCRTLELIFVFISEYTLI